MFLLNESNRNFAKFTKLVKDFLIKKSIVALFKLVKIARFIYLLHVIALFEPVCIMTQHIFKKLYFNVYHQVRYATGLEVWRAVMFFKINPSIFQDKLFVIRGNVDVLMFH